MSLPPGTTPPTPPAPPGPPGPPGPLAPLASPGWLRAVVDVDALAAVALTVLVLEHWLLTAFATTNQVAVTNLLTAIPSWAPAAWLPQLALALLFFAGGHARATRPSPRRQALRPVMTFLIAWAGALIVLLANGFSQDTIRQILATALEPMTYLIPYLLLTAISPHLLRPTRHHDWTMALTTTATTILALQLDPTLLCTMPYLLGLTWGQTHPKTVDEQPQSHPVNLINRYALPLYLWHPTTLILTALTTTRLGPIAGLNDPPTGPHWLLTRLAWLPALTTVLIGLIALTRRR